MRGLLISKILSKSSTKCFDISSVMGTKQNSADFFSLRYFHFKASGLK
jgi:hypothetical protein